MAIIEKPYKQLKKGYPEVCIYIILYRHTHLFTHRDVGIAYTLSISYPDNSNILSFLIHSISFLCLCNIYSISILCLCSMLPLFYLYSTSFEALLTLNLNLFIYLSIFLSTNYLPAYVYHLHSLAISSIFSHVALLHAQAKFTNSST